MDKVLVTGVTGNIGKLTVEHLLKRGVNASQIFGLARRQEGVTDLVDKGVQIRIGDYADYDSLLRAFADVDKIMLTSAVAFSDRFEHHKNVITAAREAGVKHIVYMSIMRKPGSGRVMPGITESDVFTEQFLQSSGLNYTIVFHPPFTDALPLYYSADPFQDGIKVPAGDGKVAPASRGELAEAHAVILSTPGHENKTYSLGGSDAVSFKDIARLLQEITGKPVNYTTITQDQYIDGLTAKGTPRPVAEFLNNWIVAILEGEFAYQSGDLQRLLGRETESFKAYLETTLPNA